MAHSIQLTDGVTTADLYALSATFVGARGWEMAGGGSDVEVGESLDLVLQGGTAGTQAAAVAALQTQVRTIERLLTAAERRTRTGVGNKVYLVVQLDSEAAAWRSEVRSGRLDMTDAADRLHSRVLSARLGLTRLNFWEWAAADIELQLSSNGNGAATGGRALTNGVNSWLQIAAAQVTGNVPAPLRLELLNSAGSARTFANIQVALNADNDPAAFTHVLEAEMASSTGGTVTASATSSGGSMRRLTVNTTGTITLPLSAAMMQKTKGAPFLLVARIQALSGFMTVRTSLRSGGAILWQAHQPVGLDRTTPHLAIVGMVPLPPTAWESDVNGAITLSLDFKSVTSQTIDLDFVAFLPCAPDTYRLLTLLGASVASGGTVIDNAIEGWAAVRTSSLDVPLTSPRGSPIMLRPNTLQRLYVLQQTDDDMLIADVLTARAYYRPRRLTL